MADEHAAKKRRKKPIYGKESGRGSFQRKVRYEP